MNKYKAQDLGYELLPGTEWIKQHVDVLVPAAIENQITIDNVNEISHQVKIIAEAANGPTNLEADQVIQEQGLLVIPDLLANAGGAICSYFEQVQNNMNYYWRKDEVLGKLDRQMTTAHTEISDFAKANKLNLREAAHVVAVDRVAQASQLRGWI